MSGGRSPMGGQVVLSKGQLFSLSQMPWQPMLWTSRLLPWQVRTAPQNPSVCPRNSYQAGKNISRNEHVEDIVPACGGNETSQQGPQGCTYGEHSVREGPLLRGPGQPSPRISSRARSEPRTRPGLGCWGREPEPQTYGARAVDDGRDRGQCLRVALQTLVSPLGRKPSGRPKPRGSTTPATPPQAVCGDAHTHRDRYARDCPGLGGDCLGKSSDWGLEPTGKGDDGRL